MINPQSALTACEELQGAVAYLDEKYPEAMTELKEFMRTAMRHAGMKAPYKVILGTSPEKACERMLKFGGD